MLTAPVVVKGRTVRLGIPSAPSGASQWAPGRAPSPRDTPQCPNLPSVLSGARIISLPLEAQSGQAGAGGNSCPPSPPRSWVLGSWGVCRRWWSHPWKGFILPYSKYVYYKLKSAALLLFPKGISSDEWFNCLAWKLADNYSCYSFQPKLLSWELNSSLFSCLHASHFLLSLTQLCVSALPLSGWVHIRRQVQLCSSLSFKSHLNAHIKHI